MKPWPLFLLLLAGIDPAPEPTTVPRVASGEIDHGTACLALVAFAEARSEGADGMALVMHTVLNRVGDRRWETSICDVINEPSQYHGIRDWPTPREPWAIDQASWALALETAQRVIDEHAAGLRPCDADITHFDQARRTPGLSPACRHGAHQFYIEPHRAVSRAGGRNVVSDATVTPSTAPAGGSETAGKLSHTRQKAP
jgi:hypothetical protein